MTIECDNIDQEINRLLIAFQDCKQIKNSDLEQVVELIAAVRSCALGGKNYNTRVTTTYEPLTDTIITYPVNSYHSIEIGVLTGSIIYAGFKFSAGSSKVEEFTTLNQTALSFTIKGGSKVLVEQIIETI